MTNNGTCQRELGTKNKTFLASNFIPIVKPFWSDFHFSTICHFLHLFVWCCCVHVCLAQFTCLCQRELVTYDTVKQLQRTGTHLATYAASQADWRASPTLRHRQRHLETSWKTFFPVGWD